MSRASGTLSQYGQYGYDVATGNAEKVSLSLQARAAERERHGDAAVGAMDEIGRWALENPEKVIDAYEKGTAPTHRRARRSPGTAPCGRLLSQTSPSGTSW